MVLIHRCSRNVFNYIHCIIVQVHIIFLIFVLCCFNDYFQFICIIVFQRECSCQLQKNGICPCIQNCELSSYIEVICFFGDVIAYLICFCTLPVAVISESASTSCNYCMSISSSCSYSSANFQSSASISAWEASQPICTPDVPTNATAAFPIASCSQFTISPSAVL